MAIERAEVEEELPRIPPYAPWIPVSLGHFEPPRARGPDFEVLDVRLEIPGRLRSSIIQTHWTQYWKRCSAYWIPCGESLPGIELTIESGLTDEEAREFSANVGLDLPHGLSAGVKGTIAHRLVRSRRTVQKFTLPEFKANKCERKYVATWQVMDVVRIRTISHTFRRREAVGPWKRFEVPSDEHTHTTINWPDDECCKGPVSDQRTKNLYVVTFPTGQRSAYGEGPDKSGRISLEGLKGAYRLGDVVALNAFVVPDPSLAVAAGPELTFGILAAQDDPAPWALPIAEGESALFDAALGRAAERIAMQTATALGGVLPVLGVFGVHTDVVAGLLFAVSKVDPRSEYSLMTGLAAAALVEEPELRG